MKSDIALLILRKNKKTYNIISSHFDESRKNVWESMYNFLPYIKAGDKVLDAGCGNGRLLELFKDTSVEYIGIDNSESLLSVARKRHPERKFIHAEIFSLPFPDKSFNVVCCIAVLHHIPSKELRRKVLQEFRRVLKDDGILIMTNWFRYTKRFIKPILYYTFLKILGISKLDFKDIYLEWSKSGHMRYYHCFTPREHKMLVSSGGFKILEASKETEFWDKKKSVNMVVIAKI